MENEITLEKQKMVIIGYLSEELWKDFIALNEPTLHFIEDMFCNEIVARLTMQVFTKDENEYEFEWYKSWWQELRMRILPQWWTRRYPSKREVKKKIKTFSTYPSIKIADMEHKARINFHDLYIPKDERFKR